MKSTSLLIISLTVLSLGLAAEPLMLEAKEDFINKISKTNLAVFYYGTSNSQEYSAY